MSDLMLLGVLNMPSTLWTGEPIDVAQRHSRYLQAAERIESDGKHIAELEQQNTELKANNEALRESFNNLLNDCINFDGGKLTDSILKQSSDLLKQTPAESLAAHDKQVIEDFVKFYRDKDGIASSRVLSASKEYSLINKHKG
jgi:hypothetical protein